MAAERLVRGLAGRAVVLPLIDPCKGDVWVVEALRTLFWRRGGKTISIGLSEDQMRGLRGLVPPSFESPDYPTPKPTPEYPVSAPPSRDLDRLNETQPTELELPR